MLPILRVLPVGGVLLAILILILALSPPDGSRAPLPRGALVDRDRQAETRQFLIHAALKRADELSRLRELPDTRARSDGGQSKLAGIPGERSDTDPDESSSINETPAINIPIGIDQPPASEMLAPSPPESTSIKKPEESKSQQEAKRRVAHRPRRTKIITGQPRPLNLFEILFGQQSASISQQSGSQAYPYPVYRPQQTGPQQYQYPAYSAHQTTGYQQYQQPAYSSQQTGYQQHQQQTYQQPAYNNQQAYQQQYQQPANSYQQYQTQSGSANQPASQSTRTPAAR